MAVTTVDVAEVSARWAEILSLASAGTEIIVTENDVPRARLVPFVAGLVRVPGLHPGAFQMAPDFNDPLPDEFWQGKQ